MRLLALILLLTECWSYKFLVYSPIFSYSHMKFFGTIADILTAAGHDVTMLMPVMDETLVSKPGVVLTKKRIFVEPDEYISRIFSDMKKYRNLWTTEVDVFSTLEQFRNMTYAFRHGCRLLAQREDLIIQLKQEQFDVAIAEGFGMCAFGFFELLGINKTIAGYSTAIHTAFGQYFGEPSAPSYIPSMMSASTSKMNFFQRARNLFDTIMGNCFIAHHFGKEHEVFEELDPYFKSTEDLIAQASLVFTNSNPYLNYPRPLVQKTIEIGGLTVDIEKKGKLPKELDDLLNKREHTVYISFGSVAKSKDMPMEWKTSLATVFERMPNVTFIWKYEESTNITSHLNNVYLSSWLPQNELLGDKRLSLFITHGGLGSITEVAYSGVPAIAIPLFAEQPRNAHMLARHGGAIALQKSVFANSDKLQEAIRTVLDDKRYSKSSAKLSETLLNKPISNKDLLVKHCEFVAKYGPLTQLDAEGRKLTTIEYYYIDAVLLLCFVLLVFLILFKKLLHSCRYRLWNAAKAKKE